MKGIGSVLASSVRLQPRSAQLKACGLMSDLVGGGSPEVSFATPVYTACENRQRCPDIYAKGRNSSEYVTIAKQHKDIMSYA